MSSWDFAGGEAEVGTLLKELCEGATWTGTNQGKVVVKGSVDPVPGSASHLGEVTLALSAQRQPGKRI